MLDLVSDLEASPPWRRVGRINAEFRTKEYSYAAAGKHLCGIKVVGLDGERLSFRRALLRNLAKIVSALPLGIGYLLAVFTERRQVLHDMLAGAVVVRTDRAHPFKALLLMAAELAMAAGSMAILYCILYVRNVPRH